MAYLGLFAYGARIASNWRRRRLRQRTRMIIEGLPAGIRKDIGWPDPLPDAPGFDLFPSPKPRR